MTDAEFTALTGCTFPLPLDDLPAALDKLQAAGYTAKVRVEEDRVGNMAGLGLAIQKSEEGLCPTTSPMSPLV